MNKNIRLYTDTELTPDCDCILSQEKSHYLCNVMRCKEGDTIFCFNESCGEFSARIKKIDKKKTIIEILQQLRRSEKEPDLWLLFAPLKKDKTDFVIEKSTELGASKIIPVMTKYTNSDKIKRDRFVMQAIEASEQCHRLSVPSIEELAPLRNILEKWDNNRVLFFMNERRDGENVVETFTKTKTESAAILVGPEGGFCDEEVKFITSFPFVKNISLGPRILRAETAVVSALSVWQACAGDWNT